MKTLMCICLTVVGSILPAAAQGKPPEPELIQSIPAVIPESAKASGLGGWVVVNVVVDDSGNVRDIESHYGPGPVCENSQRQDVVDIRNAARQAAMMAKFDPANQNGVNIASTFRLAFAFPPSGDNKSIVTLGMVKPFRLVPGSRDPNRFTVRGQPTPMPLRGAPPLSKGVLNDYAKPLPKPQYPPAANAVGVSGEVEVAVLIDESGDVFTAEAVSGHDFLRPASVRAACEAKFDPLLIGDKPMKVFGRIVYRYLK